MAFDCLELGGDLGLLSHDLLLSVFADFQLKRNGFLNELFGLFDVAERGVVLGHNAVEVVDENVVFFGEV